MKRFLAIDTRLAGAKGMKQMQIVLTVIQVNGSGVFINLRVVNVAANDVNLNR